MRKWDSLVLAHLPKGSQMPKKHRVKAQKRHEWLRELERQKDAKAKKREEKKEKRARQHDSDDDAAPPVAVAVKAQPAVMEKETTLSSPAEPRTTGGQAPKKKWRAE